jgi:hypothetical protein
MSIQLVCSNGEEVGFPCEFTPYSTVASNIYQNQEEDSDAEGSDEDEDDVSPQPEKINIKASQQVCNLMLVLLKMNFKEDHSNAAPVPKKVTAPKFNIAEELGADTVEFMGEAGKDGVFAIATVADFLGIRLVAHLCFTWIAHTLNFGTTKDKMEWLGIDGEPPTFEEIMEVNLETGHIPSMDEDGGGGGGGGEE